MGGGLRRSGTGAGEKRAGRRRAAAGGGVLEGMEEVWWEKEEKEEKKGGGDDGIAGDADAGQSGGGARSRGVAVRIEVLAREDDGGNKGR